HHLYPILAQQLGKDRAHRTAVHLAVDLLREAARLGREGASTADEDRRAIVTVASTAALLLLEHLGGTGKLRARELRLGSGPTGVAIRHDDLVHEILAEFAPEDRLGYRQLFAATDDCEFHVLSP